MNIYLIAALISYLLGSIPFGYLLVRVFTGEDVRASGSGNIGATNVARKSPALGIVTLLLDAAKGMGAVLVVARLFAEPHVELILNVQKKYLWDSTFWGGPNQQLLLTTAALFAVLGHMFPVWLKFHGGKGVATSLGAFILLAPKSILCMAVLFLIISLTFRYVSLGSVAAALSFPLFAWAFHEFKDPRQLNLIVMVSALVIWKHRQNIRRLIDGTESKFGAKAKRNSGPRPGTLGATHR
jgi:glycerol-3-phosphate acyltransferase PlsY